MGLKSQELPSWAVMWFYVTALICTWDATFIMLRPISMPGGSLHWIWYLYRYYITVDQRYQDISDSFVFAQSLMNYIEVAFNVITLVMHYNQSKHTIKAAFTVSVMTFWKTVLYFLMFTDFCTGGEYRQGNKAIDEFILVVLPNVIWVILPFAVMKDLWYKLTPPPTPAAAIGGCGAMAAARNGVDRNGTGKNGVNGMNGMNGMNGAMEKNGMNGAMEKNGMNGAMEKNGMNGAMEKNGMNGAMEKNGMNGAGNGVHGADIAARNGVTKRK